MLEIWIGVENLKKGGSRKCSYVEFLSFLYKKKKKILEKVHQKEETPPPNSVQNEKKNTYIRSKL